MKKNVIFRIAAIVLMCTLVTACFASSTFAKYTSQATAKGNDLVVAMWSFKLNDQEIATSAPLTADPFNLFTTHVNDTADDAQEVDVKDELIAPGTKGDFKLKVQNTSEVTAEYVIKVKRDVVAPDATLKGYLEDAITVKYGTTTIDWTTADTNGWVTLPKDATNNILAIGSAAKELPFTWEWAFERTDKDTTDTALGIAARATDGTNNNSVKYNLQFQIVANQVDSTNS